MVISIFHLFSLSWTDLVLATWWRFMDCLLLLGLQQALAFTRSARITTSSENPIMDSDSHVVCGQSYFDMLTSHCVPWNWQSFIVCVTIMMGNVFGWIGGKSHVLNVVIFNYRSTVFNGSGTGFQHNLWERWRPRRSCTSYTRNVNGERGRHVNFFPRHALSLLVLAWTLWHVRSCDNVMTSVTREVQDMNLFSPLGSNKLLPHCLWTWVTSSA